MKFIKLDMEERFVTGMMICLVITIIIFSISFWQEHENGNTIWCYKCHSSCSCGYENNQPVE